MGRGQKNVCRVREQTRALKEGLMTRSGSLRNTATAGTVAKRGRAKTTGIWFLLHSPSCICPCLLVAESQWRSEDQRKGGDRYHSGGPSRVWNREDKSGVDLGVGHTEKNQQIMYFCPHTLCQHIVSFSHYFLPALGSWAKLLGSFSVPKDWGGPLVMLTLVTSECLLAQLQWSLQP